MINRKVYCTAVLLAASICISPELLVVISAAESAGPAAAAPSDTAAVMTQYQKDLQAYAEAQQAYAATVSAYWNSIDQKRQQRNTKRANKDEISINDYILTQPPGYSGPPKPFNPSLPSQQPPPAPVITIPEVADFLAASHQQFSFEPRKPQTEIDFKRAYAKVASAAGLTKDQVVRIYGFEATGNGTYDVQAGLEYNNPGQHAVSTALGYNQLLATNSVELMAENGDEFIKTLDTRAAQLPNKPRQALRRKIAIVQKMIEFSKTVPDQWVDHQKLAGTPKGLGIHAMNLDVDVGPLLQTQKLVNSVRFVRAKKYNAALSAAELEMMNLTGDGNGFDMLMMPAAWRSQVPTANFFQQSGYEENPVVQRNNVVSTLLAATDSQMDGEIKKQGAMDMAAAFPH